MAESHCVALAEIPSVRDPVPSIFLMVPFVVKVVLRSLNEPLYPGTRTYLPFSERDIAPAEVAEPELTTLVPPVVGKAMLKFGEV